MFTTEHFIWIAISVFIVLLLTFLSLKFKWGFKKANLVMSIIALASEMTRLFTHIRDLRDLYPEAQAGGYLRAVALPLHLCSILIFIFFYLNFCKNDKRKDILLKFFLPIGIVAGLSAIMMATSGVAFNNPDSYQYFIYHASILWYAIYLICTRQVKITIKDYLRNILILFAMSIIMIWVDGAFVTCGCDTVNFFFLVSPPVSGLPFLNMNHGWHVYYIHLLFLGVIMETIVSFPFWIKKKEA